MKNIIRSVIVTAISLLVLVWLFPGVSVTNTVTLLMAAVVLALLNATLKPLLKLLFLPINLITLGIFGWIVHVLVLYLVTLLVPGLQIGSITLLGMTFSSFWSLVIAAMAMSFVSGWLGALL